tara:strand:+ start:232 stop:483 length:252 start_codon:yes stop_codon:yes gene_type:complete
MVSTPQLPFDIISKILQDRKNILQEERQIKETKENFDWMMGEFNSICWHAKNDNMVIEDGKEYIISLIENIEVSQRLIYGDDY